MLDVVSVEDADFVRFLTSTSWERSARKFDDNPTLKVMDPAGNSNVLYARLW